jgi:hypothetical protein
VVCIRRIGISVIRGGHKRGEGERGSPVRGMLLSPRLAFVYFRVIRVVRTVHIGPLNKGMSEYSDKSFIVK